MNNFEIVHMSFTHYFGLQTRDMNIGIGLSCSAQSAIEKENDVLSIMRKFQTGRHGD